MVLPPEPFEVVVRLDKSFAAKVCNGGVLRPPSIDDWSITIAGDGERSLGQAPGPIVHIDHFVFDPSGRQSLRLVPVVLLELNRCHVPSSESKLEGSHPWRTRHLTLELRA